MRSAAIFLVVLGGCNAILGLDPQHLRADADIDAASPADATSDAPATDVAALDAIAEEGGASAYAREVLADGPLLYYRFGEPGGTTVHDETHALDGAYPSFGVTFKVPGALQGDRDTAITLGGQSKITVPQGADFTGKVPYSVEVWLEIDAQPPGLAFIVDHEAWPDPRHGWDIVLDSTGLSFERYGAGVNTAVGAPTLPTATWTHVLYTWDGSTGRSFLNGTLASESTNAFDIDAVAGTFSVGGQNCDCSSTYYKGSIDELAIYAHVLAGDRVQAHLRAAGR